MPQLEQGDIKRVSEQASYISNLLVDHIDKGADHYEFKDCNVLIIFAYMSQKRNLGQTAFYYRTEREEEAHNGKMVVAKTTDDKFRGLSKLR